MKKIFILVLALAASVSLLAEPIFKGQKELTINGKTRTYYLYVPEGLPANSPLVITCHAVGGSGYSEFSADGWKPMADKENFIVAYPDGIASGYHWKFNSYTNGWDLTGMTDVNFMLAIVDSVKKEYNIDATRVYMSGFSIGGEFVYHVANNAADKFAAFVPISGCSNPATVTVTASRPVPIFHVHGTADNIYLFQDAQSCIQAWVAAQHCDAAVTTTESGFECRRYKNGDGDTEIVFCIKQGGSHDWYASATTAIWDFCKQYTTQGKVATGIEEVPSDKVPSTKVMENGVLYLMYEGRMYDVRGHIVR